MDEEIIIVFCVLAYLIYLCVDVATAISFADIAAEKGHNRKTYFWRCFGFGVSVVFSFVGYLMVVALPDRKLQDAVIGQRTPAREDLPEI